MINIGIDKHLGLVYEGDSNYGRGIWPTPVITSAKFVYPSDEDLKACSSSDLFGYRFREDSYDPIARIRRGRFYCTQDSLLQQWKVARHPGSPFDSIAPDIHGFGKSLETFYGNPIWYKIQERKEFPIVLLGVDDRFTTWTVSDNVEYLPIYYRDMYSEIVSSKNITHLVNEIGDRPLSPIERESLTSLSLFLTQLIQFRHIHLRIALENFKLRSNSDVGSGGYKPLNEFSQLIRR